MIATPNETVDLRSRAANLSAGDQVLAAVLDQYLTALEKGAPIAIEQLADEHPALADDIRSFAASIELLHAAAHGSDRTLSEEHAPHLGATIEKRLGDFEIIREIGRGGMGVVYEAEQLSLARRVALKVLPFAAMWDRKQLSRFQNEARAAAQLHHPHIVPVFGVGQERGVHYYAMQLVEGRPLDALIAELKQGRGIQRGRDTVGIAGTTAPLVPAPTESPSIAASAWNTRHATAFRSYCEAVAQLGVDAADALHYAHDCGVIHRDVKPSNLLIDERNSVWIADFGLARIQGDAGVTATGDVVGTLRYMSPEQASGRQALIDARADVYSLGATLYELLTLEPAFPGEDRRAVLKAVIEREPRSPRDLQPAIPLDLETIVMHAMAKAREERYATAAEFADDLRRFLESKPTRARRPTLLDRGAKLVRRHRLASAVGLTFLVILTAVSTIGALMLSREQARTAAALDDAKTSLRQARQVVDRFGNQFVEELARLPGSEPLRNSALADALAYNRAFLARAADDPGLAAEVATTQYQAGLMAGRLGDFTAARADLQGAADRFAALAQTTADKSLWRQRLAACWNSLALVEADHGDAAQATALYAKAIALQENLAAGNRQSASTQQLAQILANRGLLARRRGDLIAAGRDFARAIELLRELTSADPDDAAIQHDLALALNNRSFVEQAGDLAAARESCSQAVDLFRDLSARVADRPDETASIASDLALSLNNLGAILGHQGDNDAAAEAYREAVTRQEQLVRQAPAIVQYRSDLAITTNNLGQALARGRKGQQAAEAFTSAERLFQQLADDYPQESRYRSALAGVQNNRGMATELRGDAKGALADYQRAIANQRQALTAAPHSAAYRDFLDKHLANSARCLIADGQIDEGLAVVNQRETLWENEVARLYDVAADVATLAETLDDDLSTGGDADLAGPGRTQQKSAAREALLAKAVEMLTASASATRGATARDSSSLPAALRERLDPALLARLGEKR